VRLEIGYGLRGIGSRLSGAFWAALLLLVAVFVADTWTTFSAGAGARLNDLNPLIRTLSPMGYIASAVVRGGGVAVLVLVWFWPGHLRRRFPGHKAWALLIPFAFRDARRYFGVNLVLLAVPLKSVAVWNNIQVLAGQNPILGTPGALGLGLAGGVLLSNLLLYRHVLTYRRSLPRTRD